MAFSQSFPPSCLCLAETRFVLLGWKPAPEEGRRSSLSPCRGVGKKPKFKNTNLTRARPYVYENRVRPAELQRSQMLGALRDPPQIPKVATWRHVLGPLRFVSLRRCCAFGFRQRTAECTFLTCVTFTDEFCFIMTVGMGQQGHLRTVDPLRLSAQTQTRGSFNAKPGQI